MLEYKSPTTLETPEIHTILVETDDPEGPVRRQGGRAGAAAAGDSRDRQRHLRRGRRAHRRDADHARQGAARLSSSSARASPRASVRIACRSSASRSRWPSSPPSASRPRRSPCGRSRIPSARHDAAAPVHVPGARVRSRTRCELMADARARRHAGGRRHRSLPEHEAAAVRAEDAGRAPRRSRRCAGSRGTTRDGHAPSAPATTLTVGRRAPRGRARAMPALATAAGLVSSPQLRNMGTIGGNVCVDTRCNYYNQSYEWRKAVDFCMKKDGDICLVAPASPRCWAVSSSDTAPVLWSLGARVRLVGPAGERTIPDRRALPGRRHPVPDQAAPTRSLTEILLPPAEGWRSAYLKLRRRGSFDFPVLGVAAARADGRRHRARGAHRARRGRLAAARGHRRRPQLLVGQRLTTELIDAAADAAAGPARSRSTTPTSPIPTARR